MVALTPRQTEVLDWIAGYMRSKGYAPSRREIMAGLNFKSPNTVTGHLRALERKGRLTWVRGACRTIRLIDAPPYIRTG